MQYRITWVDESLRLRGSCTNFPNTWNHRWRKPPNTWTSTNRINMSLTQLSLTLGVVSNLVYFHPVESWPRKKKSVSTLGLETGASSVTGIFDRLTVPSLDIIETSKVAFSIGSSQQGNARRAAVACRSFETRNKRTSYCHQPQIVSMYNAFPCLHLCMLSNNSLFWNPVNKNRSNGKPSARTHQFVCKGTRMLYSQVDCRTLGQRLGKGNGGSLHFSIERYISKIDHFDVGLGEGDRHMINR